MAEYIPFKTPEEVTSFDPLTEMTFRNWVQKNNVAFDPDSSAPQDYDMRGYWSALQRGQPMATSSEINPNDGLLHYPDFYKTPIHQSFSSESQWANPDTPQWISSTQLASPNGRVVFDENQKNTLVNLLMRTQ